MQKLWLLFGLAIALAIFGLSPFQTTDVAQLVPVQTMVISSEGGAVRVECGEKLSGRGKDLEAALSDLKAGAEGNVFLGTAQQIVVISTDELWGQMLQISELRPAARLYQSETALKAEDITAFLMQHKTNVTLLDLRIARLYEETLMVPCLIQGDGGYRIDGRKPV